jgi:small subunit ribosomal protein S2
VIAGVLGRAGEEGQKRRLEDAANNIVTWLPPENLGKPFEERDKEEAAKKKEAELLKAEEVDEQPTQSEFQRMRDFDTDDL